MTVTLAPDGQAVGDEVVALVEALNAVLDFIRAQTQADPESGTAGPLHGDSSVRLVTRRLQTIVSDATNLDSPFASLSAVGITTQRDGTLAVDRARLDAAIADDVDAVVELVAGETATAAQGVADRLRAAADALADPTEGVPALRRDALEDEARYLSRQIDRAESRLEDVEADLIARFAALERLIAALRVQGDLLASFLGRLEATDGPLT